MARDSKGDVFVTGSTESPDFPTTAGAYQTHLKGTSDAFVTELNTTGTALVHSTLLGGSANDSGSAVRLDGSGNVYVTGEADSADFPTLNGAFQRTLRGESDAFVTKFKPTLNALVYSTYLGGSSDDHGNAIVVDSSNNAYVAGLTASTDFPLVNPTVGQYQGGGFPTSNGFAAVLTSDGSAMWFGTYVAGIAGPYCNSDVANGISVRSNTLYVGGQTCSQSFPVTPGAFQTGSTAQESGFVQAISDVIP
jgi:hypothetical protein